jgi:hypothetical protein
MSIPTSFSLLVPAIKGVHVSTDGQMREPLVAASERSLVDLAATRVACAEENNLYGDASATAGSNTEIAVPL